MKMDLGIKTAFKYWEQNLYVKSCKFYSSVFWVLVDYQLKPKCQYYFSWQGYFIYFQKWNASILPWAGVNDSIILGWILSRLVKVRDQGLDWIEQETQLNENWILILDFTRFLLILINVRWWKLLFWFLFSVLFFNCHWRTQKNQGPLIYKCNVT